ncbi:MAG: glucose-6-phosphate isomerase [Clostridia bacterium]|jgi:glucose-6-phosphate isomerase
MKIVLDDCLSFASKSEFYDLMEKAKQANRLLKNRNGAGSDFLGWLDLPKKITKEEIQYIKEIAKKIQDQSKVLVVIGIGGSYLGARAAIEALTDTMNKKGTEIIYVGNNISGKYIESVLEYLKDKEFSLNVISKSGTTTEPAIAFRIFKEALYSRYRNEAKNRIYITTDKKNGSLRSIANKEGYVSFEIPSDVGGRYSILTPCGLLPIAVSGIDIEQMIDGAKFALENLEDMSLQYAAIRNLMYLKGKTIEIMVNYDPSLHYMTEWWKQLYGESEGKDNKGIFPAGVDNTTDLHSMGQYIQEGLRNIFETVIYVKNDMSEICIPDTNDDSDGLDYIKNKSLKYVNEKAMLGTKIAHVNGNVPVNVIEIEKMDAFTYGQIVYFFEKACGISGYILGVNPFNQPGVEAYKKNMFKLLGKSGY